MKITKMMRIKHKEKEGRNMEIIIIIPKNQRVKEIIIYQKQQIIIKPTNDSDEDASTISETDRGDPPNVCTNNNKPLQQTVSSKDMDSDDDDIIILNVRPQKSKCKTTTKNSNKKNKNLSSQTADKNQKTNEQANQMRHGNNSKRRSKTINKRSKNTSTSKSKPNTSTSTMQTKDNNDTCVHTQSSECTKTELDQSGIDKSPSIDSQYEINDNTMHKGEKEINEAKKNKQTMTELVHTTFDDDKNKTNKTKKNKKKRNRRQLEDDFGDDIDLEAMGIIKRRKRRKINKKNKK